MSSLEELIPFVRSYIFNRIKHLVSKCELMVLLLMGNALRSLACNKNFGPGALKVLNDAPWLRTKLEPDKNSLATCSSRA